MSTKLNKALIKEYEGFFDEVVKKLVRAEIDKAVFDIRRNETDRNEKEREQQNKLYISSSDAVKDFEQIIEIIVQKIADLKGQPNGTKNN